MQTNLKAAMWMLWAAFTAAIMISMIRHVSHDVPILQIVFLRNAVALLLLMPWAYKMGLSYFKTRRIGMYSLRAVVGIIAMTLWFLAVARVPLATATSLSFLAPLLTACMAAYFFKERYGIRRILALIVGFIGTLIVLRPATSSFDPNALYALYAAFFWAASGVIIKTLTRTEDPKKVVFYMVLFLTPLSLPLALTVWEPVPMNMWLWIIAIGVVSNLFQTALNTAIQQGDFAVILPVDFTRLIFATLFGLWFFGEHLDLYSCIGSVVILSSAVYTAFRERQIS